MALLEVFPDRGTYFKPCEYFTSYSRYSIGIPITNLGLIVWQILQILVKIKMAFSLFPDFWSDFLYQKVLKPNSILTKNWTKRLTYKEWKHQKIQQQRNEVFIWPVFSLFLYEYYEFALLNYVPSCLDFYAP